MQTKEIQMDSNDRPVDPAGLQITDTPPTDGTHLGPTATETRSVPATRPSGFRRTVLTAGMAAALLVAGGAAVVSAASPDPSASPTPATTTNPSADGSTTPSTSATPGTGTRANCPHDGTSDATPSPTPTPTG